MSLSRFRILSPQTILTTLLSCWLVLGSGQADAGRPPDVTDAEMAMLPRYCPDTQGFKYGDAYSNTSPNAGKWVAMMGQGFWAVHHYCWGLIEVQRAGRPGTPPVIRRGLLESATGNFAYVVEHSPPDFVLLPEILTWIGRIDVRLGRASSAAAAFERAQTLKPDYWPAYSHWADYLIVSGKKAEAKKVVKSGLEYSPTARLLIDQYRQLGGNPAEIVPKPVPRPPDDAQASAPAGQEETRSPAAAAGSAETKPADTAK